MASNIKSKIGATAFRKIHYLSLVAYLGATLHGLYAGTHSVLTAASLHYKGTFLVTLFLAVYWLVKLYFRKREEQKPQVQHSRKDNPRSIPARKNETLSKVW